MRPDRARLWFIAVHPVHSIAPRTRAPSLSRPLRICIAFTSDCGATRGSKWPPRERERERETLSRIERDPFEGQGRSLRHSSRLASTFDRSRLYTSTPRREREEGERNVGDQEGGIRIQLDGFSLARRIEGASPTRPSIPRDFLRMSAQGKPRRVRVIGAVTSELNIIFSDEWRPLNLAGRVCARAYVRVIGPIIAATWCRTDCTPSLLMFARRPTVRPISPSTG